SCGTCLDARRLEPLRNAAIPQPAFENFRLRLAKFWNFKGTARHGIAAPDSIGFLKIRNAVRVLPDGAVGWASDQASRLLAVHALILAHQQLHSAVLALVFVELDQIPVIPRRLRHRLVAVVECSFGERISVPFQTRYFASLAADTRGCVYELADPELAIESRAGNAAGVP